MLSSIISWTFFSSQPSDLEKIPVNYDYPVNTVNTIQIEASMTDTDDLTIRVCQTKK